MLSRAGKYLPNIMIYIISVAILGIGELLEASFSGDRLRSDSFIFNVCIPSAINLMILFNTIYMYKRMFPEKSNEYIEKKDDINDTLRASVGSDLGKFLFGVKNKDKKINAYKRHIQKKLDRLDNGFLHMFRKPTTDDMLLWNSNDEAAKKKNKYCITRQKLMNLLEEDYIEANIMYLNVKYRPIKESEIRNGYRSKTIDDDDFEDIDRSIKWDVLPGYLQGFLFSTFFYSFILNPKDVSLVMALTILVKLFTGVWNFFNGKNYAENVLLKKMLNNLDKVINILKEYCQWKIDQKKAGEAS